MKKLYYILVDLYMLFCNPYLSGLKDMLNIKVRVNII